MDAFCSMDYAACAPQDCCRGGGQGRDSGYWADLMCPARLLQRRGTREGLRALGRPDLARRKSGHRGRTYTTAQVENPTVYILPDTVYKPTC